MDDTQQQQLRDDLQFAIMKMEQLMVLDAKSVSKNHPFEIKSLVDVFAVFGYTADDFIDRHDQCTIFKRIRGELEGLLRDFSTHTKKYDKAVLLRDRLQLIKKEFIDMQGKYEYRRQDQERSQFHRGIVLARKHSDVLCDARTQESEREIQHKRNDLEKTHRVERAQLESFLHKLPEPHVKFSKLLLELKDTEKNLAKLRQFEDAKNVFLQADALEKKERARNTENFEKLKETKRALLREKHEQEIAELGEKLMEKRYILMRVNNNHRKSESQRMTNLRHDMNHSHTMDLHEKKQFSTNAVSTARKSHHTSSTFRGQQLLSTVQGKRLEVTSLCKLHDHENGAVPDGSVIFSG
uniref:Uncharacterized protein n=1 Tax=Globisporangium ultimum (strain ATCC 200006 / CBS 805.95 / DAOM BR144) TaxID=431595 RepID=K3WGM1_GLOUD